MESGDSDLDDYYYYNESDDDGSFGSSQQTYCGFRPSFLYSERCRLPVPTYRTPEEAERNARELIEEEEREKEKREKKRLKKKRQKDRMRQQKQQEEGEKTPDENTEVNVRSDETSGSAAADSPASQDASESGSEGDLDLGSTFVRLAKKKIENKPRRERKERTREADKGPARSPDRGPGDPGLGVKPLIPPERTELSNGTNEDPRIQQSLELASVGNILVNQMMFLESLDYYEKAIKLNPKDYRFLGNRSYSYERLGRYAEALQDAERALELQSYFIKGHFRKGRALKGLKRYPEAIGAFQQVLIRDGTHQEAAEEIEQCSQELMKCLKLQPRSTPAPPSTQVTALDSLWDCNKTKSAPVPPPAVPSKLYPVWVGNVTDRITESILRSQFERFGPIHSMRILYSRTCAFINYTSKEAAECAFRELQGLTIENTAFVLQLRNPEQRNLNVAGM